MAKTWAIPMSAILNKDARLGPRTISATIFQAIIKPIHKDESLSLLRVLTFADLEIHIMSPLGDTGHVSSAGFLVKKGKIKQLADHREKWTLYIHGQQ